MLVQEPSCRLPDFLYDARVVLTRSVPSWLEGREGYENQKPSDSFNEEIILSICWCLIPP